MSTYRDPVQFKGLAAVRCADDEGRGDYIGGLPSDVDAEIGPTAPSLCGVRVVDFTIQGVDPAPPVERG